MPNLVCLSNLPIYYFRYNWLWNGADVQTSLRADKMKVYNNGTLVITKFYISEEGYYQCTAGNQFGVAYSQIIELRQQGKHS